MQNSLPNKKLFSSDIILHFSYHKCLTLYFNKIMDGLSQEFGFYRKHFNNRVNDFENAVFSCQEKCVLSVNNHSDLRFEKYPSYKGSHFIRDPRDLVVSGYRYHLHTQEAWCRNSAFDWERISSHPYFSEYVESNREKHPHNVSYQDYLKLLDFERGTIVELLWRQKQFTEMEKWDFKNPRIIEKRYEDIIGNEIECFNDIFLHYDFHPKLVSRGLELVDKYSLKNCTKRENGHIRKGNCNQWVSEFTPLHKELFKNLNGELLIALNYEKNFNW